MPSDAQRKTVCSLIRSEEQEGYSRTVIRLAPSSLESTDPNHVRSGAAVEMAVVCYEDEIPRVGFHPTKTPRGILLYQYVLRFLCRGGGILYLGESFCADEAGIHAHGCSRASTVPSGGPIVLSADQIL